MCDSGFAEKQMIPWHYTTKNKDESMTPNYPTVRLKQSHCPQQRWSQTNPTSLPFLLNLPFCPYSSCRRMLPIGSFFFLLVFSLIFSNSLLSFLLSVLLRFPCFPSLCLLFVCFLEDLCSLASLARCSITGKSVLGARESGEALSYLVTRLRGSPLLWVWWVLVFSKSWIVL